MKIMKSGVCIEEERGKLARLVYVRRLITRDECLVGNYKVD
jgi:hypothetical protein